MSNWLEYRFGDLVHFPPHVPIGKGEELPFIEMEAVDPSSRYVEGHGRKKYGSSSCSKFANGDVLLARITPCLENGKIAQARISGNGFGSTEFFVFRAKDDLIDQGFLFYLSKCDLIWKSAVNSMVGASGRQRADAAFLKKVKLRVPRLPTQRKISAVLSAYDDLIENNKLRIALLEKMAEEIYREWFVRRRFPGHEEIARSKGVPNGWAIDRVDSIGKIITGKTPSTSTPQYFGGQYPFIKTPDMHGNTFVFDTEDTLTQGGLDSQKSQTVPANSICVSCIGTGGVVSITTTTSQTNQQINTVILNADHDLEWAFYTIRSLKEVILMFGATGATMTNLSKGKLSSLKIIVPDEALRLNFHECVRPMFDQMKILLRINRDLNHSKSSILPRLISGRLSVENLDIHFPPSIEEDGFTPTLSHEESWSKRYA